MKHVASAPGASPARDEAGFDFSAALSRYGTVGAAVVVFVAFALASGRFISAANISNILVQISVLMVTSAGLSIAVASGEFDLSVGEVASLGGVLVAGLIVWSHLPWPLAILVAVVMGIGIGLINGLLVTRLRIPSMIATLAMGPIALGANYAYDGGDSIYAVLPPEFYWISTGRLFGVVPVPIVIALVIVAVVCYVLLNRCALAAPSSPPAPISRRRGFRASKSTGRACSPSRFRGFGAAMGGIMLTARLGSGQSGRRRALPD